LFIFGITSLSQNQLKDYEENYYVTFLPAHPGVIVHTGNNWDILFAFKKSGPLNKLNELGISYTQKQIDVLCALNLLEKENDQYRTIGTILNEEDMKDIRLFTMAVANKIIPLIRDDFSKLSAALKKEGYEKNSYTVLFSYVMDHLVWDLFESNHILKEKELTVENPLWDGTVWFYKTKRNFECGTNSYPADSLLIASNWANVSELSLTNLDYKSILEEYIKNSKINDDALKNYIKVYGICDENGNIKIPVIVKGDESDIVNSCNKIAQSIYDFMVNKVDYLELNNKFNIHSREDAIIIIYHDIMWDILDILEEKGLVQKPIIFSNPEAAQKSDLKDVLLIYHK
jgi:hypothetical protein